MSQPKTTARAERKCRRCSRWFIPKDATKRACPTCRAVELLELAGFVVTVKDTKRDARVLVVIA